ncbi:MAG: hypothetical protein MUO31_06800 [Thermodesulfovibrionales bacterium]|nr:hypothetical protein [Thermodesulfovibrionales bacterium]
MEISQKDLELLKDLKTKEENGMKITESYTSMFQESLRYFFSDQLHGKALHKDWDWIIVNYIWPSAMQEIAKLAKNYPKILAHPQSDDDSDAAEVWQSALQWIWEKGLHHEGMRMQQIRACLCGKLFGYRVSKVFWEDQPDGAWDEEKQEWVGDVKHRIWHPSEFWASDKEYIQDGDCGTVRYVDLDWAVQRWPKFEKQLKEQAVSYKSAAKGGYTIRGQTGSTATYPLDGTGDSDPGIQTNRPTQLLTLIQGADKMSGQQYPGDEERKFIKLSETYFKDNETNHEKQEEDVPPQELLQQGVILPDSMGGFLDQGGQSMPSDKWPRRTVREWDRPLYPNGRFVIRCEDIILNPDNQVYPYKRWPFVVTPHYMLPFMWQGVDSVQMYKTSQDMINVTVSHLVNAMKMFGDPRIAIERGAIDVQAGRKKKYFKIFSGAGSIIRLAKGAISGKKFQIIPPQNLGSALPLYQLFAQEYKNISGMQDVAQGQKSPGEMSATQANYLAISSNDRIYLQSIFEDHWVLGIAQLAAEITQKNYAIDRFIRIVGEDKVIGAQQITQKLKTLKYDVDIEPGQTLPFDPVQKETRYEKAYAMLASPQVNPMLPDMLRVYEITNWRKILKTHESWQLFMQFNQLYQAVLEKQVTPEQALEIIVNKAKERFAQQQQSLGGISARNMEKGDFDKKQLNIDRQQGDLDIQKTIFKIEVNAEKEREQRAKQDSAKANKTKS